MIQLKSSAEESHRDGDEETAYVQYIKFFHVLTIMKSMKDYDGEKKFISDMLGGNSNVTRMMDDLNNIKTSLLARYKDLNVVEQEKIKISPSSSTKNDVVEDPSPPRKQGITSKELHKLIERNDIRLLIIDCRKMDEYEASRIKYICTLNIPKTLINMGMSAAKLNEVLDFSGKRLWKSRLEQEQIVLVDWNSKGPDPSRNSTMWVLNDILENVRES